MTNSSKSYKVGDTIEYTSFGGDSRIVKVTASFEDVKNGRPGFDGTIVGGPVSDWDDVWGYDSQITRVVKRGA